MLDNAWTGKLPLVTVACAQPQAYLVCTSHMDAAGKSSAVRQMLKALLLKINLRVNPI